MYFIRPAQKEDLSAVLGLLRDSGLPYQDVQTSSLSGFLVAAREDIIWGCIGLEGHGNVGLLRSLAVHPSERHHGIGASLTEEMERQAKRQGLASLYLLTMTAAEFFTKKGFLPIERSLAPALIQQSAQFAGLCPSQAACLYKEMR